MHENTELRGRDFASKMGAANPDKPCPDGVCDDFERNNYACPEDCGGKRGEGDLGSYKSENYEYSECKDGCNQECPGASRTDCVDNGRRCQCFYEEKESPPQEPAPTPSPEPTSEPAPVTGGVINIDNKFLDYWFER